MGITVDSDKCIGSGSCVMACPEVFGQDDDGIVVLLDAHPPASLRDQVIEAEEACPAAVIGVLEG